MCRKETTTKDDLMTVINLFENAGITYWIDGGWGVDILAGKQTRHHRDIDINFDAHYQADLEGGWYEFDKDFFSNAVFEGRIIPCISLKGQKLFHSGYELRDKDRHDISILESIEK